MLKCVVIVGVSSLTLSCAKTTETTETVETARTAKSAQPATTPNAAAVTAADAPEKSSPPLASELSPADRVVVQFRETKQEVTIDDPAKIASLVKALGSQPATEAVLRCAPDAYVRFDQANQALGTLSICRAGLEQKSITIGVGKRYGAFLVEDVTPFAALLATPKHAAGPN